MTTATARRLLLKNEFIFYFRMSQLCKLIFFSTPNRSKDLLRLNMHRHLSRFQKMFPEIGHCGLRSPKYIELSHFTLLFCRGRGKEMYKDLYGTCTAIVLLVKFFIWWRSLRRSRRDFLKLRSLTTLNWGGGGIRELTCLDYFCRSL